MPAIETNGLRKRFGGDVLALDGVDLRVDEGEIFGFLGPNGAGKSTTINILLDFVRPTSGSATVLGMDAQDQSQEIRRRTGVLPEGYQVYGRLTGRQHVQFVIDSKDVDNDPDALLERVGIPEAADRKAGEYSKGMKQRLTLAMALVGEPELLILDEPSTGLDPAGAREIREIVREEAERGATVFFSSHIMEQVEAVCDRVGILRAGELVAVDSIDGLREAAGDGATLRVELATVTDDAIAVVESVSGVTEVKRRDGGLTVSVGNGSKTRVLSALEDAGYEVTDFRTEETSLEEIFMSYTEGSR
ncbi:Copper transport ATP-binding protein [Halorhabdus tiamatea SARL4B]|uniref:ABC transporter, ATP-binding protein n=1 Tax=Halorhabdus tiamatea SARL4B TaxID=1033806 RepID=F7PL76_9EURY|nr:ABC transporter ATP-binding protein [Halorhabdus tiamatea]ERJ05831.1 Copper transport ATP-binding protein [Halorhabdus tiamatea SARL4B]CCQ34487.1 ABC transporter, ATP-binding protein [Halorhabdus tiamatea SARL4B]